MTNIPITMEQILSLSNFNKALNFLFIYFDIIFVCLFFAFLLFLFFGLLSGNMTKGYICFLAFCFLLLPATSMTALKISNSKLNENQMKLIKSVDDPKFQIFVTHFIEKEWATIYALEKTLEEIEINPDSENQKDVEFYKNIQP